MTEEKTKKRFFKTKNRFLLYGIVAVFFTMFVISFSISRLALFQRNYRDNQRVQTLEKAIVAIEKSKSETGKYPGAIFFKTGSILICSKIDCFISEEIELKGATRGASDIVNETDKNNTKYAYELTQDSYKIAFCDEDGKVRNFGKTPFGDELICK